MGSVLIICRGELWTQRGDVILGRDAIFMTISAIFFLSLYHRLLLSKIFMILGEKRLIDMGE